MQDVVLQTYVDERLTRWWTVAWDKHRVPIWPSASITVPSPIRVDTTLDSEFGDEGVIDALAYGRGDRECDRHNSDESGGEFHDKGCWCWRRKRALRQRME